MTLVAQQCVDLDEVDRDESQKADDRQAGEGLAAHLALEGGGSSWFSDRSGAAERNRIRQSIATARHCRGGLRAVTRDGSAGRDGAGADHLTVRANVRNVRHCWHLHQA